MKISAICIGDELLDGRTRDRNAARLGGVLGDYGLELADVRIVPDTIVAIGDALDDATRSSDLVVVSGGLGPTSDDVTRQAAAAWAGTSLETDEEMVERLRERFEEHGYSFTENNRRQCTFPASADILESKVGTAAGFRLESSGATAWFLPGVPDEFEWFLGEHVGPYIEEADSGSRRTSRRLTFLGLGESDLETRIRPALEAAEARGVGVSFLPDSPVVEVQVRGDDPDGVDEVEEMIRETIGDWLVVEGDRDLPERAGAALEEHGATVATAESCTGGWLSKQITDVPGSSGWFEFGFVTYANRAKIDQLEVAESTLDEDGAVSRATVAEMAAGARRRADADFALAISGVAGPTGGTPETPVGTVHFALADGDAIFHQRMRFPPKSRRYVRCASVQTSLGMLVWRLEGRLEAHDVTRLDSDH